MCVRTFRDKFSGNVVWLPGQMDWLISSAAVLSRACAYGRLARNGPGGRWIEERGRGHNMDHPEITLAT